MALTISLNTGPSVRRRGMQKVRTGTLAFDNSYAYGGESLTAANLGLQRIDDIIIHPAAGYTFQYDYTNKKVKVFQEAPPIVFEETVTVTSNVGTLRYPAAFIMYVSAGNSPYKVIPGGLTPLTTQVSVSNHSWGVRNTLTFLPGDSVTSCVVTYVTQAWKEVFDNFVTAQFTAGVRVAGHASLTFTPGTPDTMTLGEMAIGIQNILWSDNTVFKPAKALYAAETAATTEATIDFVDSSNTSIKVLASDTWDAAADSVYIQYVRKPASGFLKDRFVEEDDLTPSTDVCTLSAALGASPSNALLYGTCGDIPGPTTKFAQLIASTASVGTTATLVQPTTINNSANTFTLGSNHADTDHIKPSYIVGEQSEIPGLVSLETSDAMDLSALSGVRFTVFGR